MPKVDVARGRLEHHAPEEFSVRAVAGEKFGAQVTRVSATARSKLARQTFSVVSTEDIVQHTPDNAQRSGAVSQRRLAEMHSNINVLTQTNALLREGLSGKSQRASLTKENLMMLEDTLEHNRPAEQLRRKREFIQKEMDKRRQKAGSAEAKALLLKKINDREERQKAEKQTRSDSVLEDLRRTRFRMVAQMAQKRLQSMTPDMKDQEEELSNRIDWYLRFCGEDGEEEQAADREDSTSPVRTSTDDQH
eukprot:g2094.t1